MFSLTYILLSSIYVGSAFATSTEKATTDDLNNRIIHGNRAPKNAYPFMASLQIATPNKNSSMYPFCGGSIVSENIIVTAAHCVKENFLTKNKVFVEVGATNIANTSEGQIVAVAEVFRHPDYHSGLSYTSNERYYNLNDIAILKLAEPLKFTQGIQSISLPSKDHNAEEIDEGKGIVLGWGVTEPFTPFDSNIQTSNSLLYAYMYAAPSKYCYDRYKVRVSMEQLCLRRDKETDATSCNGDSGGPFIQTVENETKLVGITSYNNEGCARGPAGYIRVNKYLDFINKYL